MYQALKRLKIIIYKTNLTLFSGSLLRTTRRLRTGLQKIKFEKKKKKKMLSDANIISNTF